PRIAVHLAIGENFPEDLAAIATLIHILQEEDTSETEYRNIAATAGDHRAVPDRYCEDTPIRYTIPTGSGRIVVRARLHARQVHTIITIGRVLARVGYGGLPARAGNYRAARGCLATQAIVARRLCGNGVGRVARRIHAAPLVFVEAGVESLRDRAGLVAR